MENKLITGMVAAAVVVILIAGILIPALGNATDTHDTFTNTGNGQYKYISSDETYDLKWYYSTPTKVTVNGTVIDGVSGNEVFAMGDFTLRMWPNPSGFVQLILADNESGISINVSDSKDFTFSYEDGTVTASNGTTTKTIDTDGFYAIVPENGTHTMKTSTTTVYAKGDETLLIMGITQVGTQWNTGYLIDGTITDYTVEQWTGTTSYTPTNITDDSTKLDGYVDLYTIKEFQWEVDNSGTTQTVKYNTFLVPLSVTVEKSQHLTDAQIMILDVIPLLLIVAVLLAVVAVFILRRE